MAGGRTIEIDGQLVEVARPEYSFKAFVIVTRMKVLENLMLAYRDRFYGSRRSEHLFKISLIGLLRLLYYKKRVLPKRIVEKMEQGRKYYKDPTSMSFDFALDLFDALEEAIELLGYTLMEGGKVNPKERVKDDRQ